MFKTLLAACLFLIFSLLSQAQEPLNRKVSIVFNNLTLHDSFVELQRKSYVSFAFDPNIIPSEIRLNKRYSATSLSSILADILANTPLTYTYIANQVVIIKRKVISVTLDGYISDIRSGEPLIEANISVPGLNISTSTNQYGFFSLTVPAGDYAFVISHIEYINENIRLNLLESKRYNFGLKYRENQLADVVVKSSGKPDSVNLKPGIRNLTNDQLNKLSFYAGEVDVIKALQMQDGVKAMTEGSSAMFVRGGNSDQNLIMLDEAIIYNPSHLFGLVSVFNSDAIKNVQLYKDFMPASFGGRLSSVLDARMADGNNRNFQVKGGVSLLSARAAVEGPIKNQTGSFILTFRRSLIDLLNKDYRLLNPNSTYQDVNLKANYQLGKNNKIFYSFYGGDDKLFSENSFRNNWGNLTSTVRWNHVFSSKLFFNLSAIYSNYKNSLDLNSDTVTQKQVWQTGIKDKSLKTDFTYFIRPGNEFKFGSLYTKHLFTPGRIEGSKFQEPNIPQNKALEFSLYVSHRYNFRDKLNLIYGLRLSAFENAEEKFGIYDQNENLVRAKSYSNYWRLEPRVYASYSFAPRHTIHAMFNRNFQYLQLIQNSELSFSSLETWMPASEKTRPQCANHFSVGYNWLLPSYSVTANGFYKALFNQVELSEHTQLIQNPQIRDFLRYGKGEAYGMELSFKKRGGKLSNETSYTWSRALKKTEGINEGSWFRANYDIPHEVKSSWVYTVSGRLKINSFFIWASGRPVTQPVGFYYQDGIQVPIYEKRNNARFPDFHRLDLSVRYGFISKPAALRKKKHDFSVGVYNLYNKHNPLYYRLLQATAGSSLGIVNSSTKMLPWAAYSFQF